MRSTYLIGILVFVAASNLATAQFSAARAAIERIRGVSNEISPDRDPAVLIPVAKAMLEAAQSLRSGLTDCGETLAVANGAYASERARIRNTARVVREDSESFARHCANWIATLEGPNDHRTMTKEARSLAVERVIGNWDVLIREIEERRRWINNGITQAMEFRDNATKPGALLERAQAERLARTKEGEERLKRAFSDWIGATSRHYEVEARENEAYAAWESYLKTENRDSERARSLARAASDAHKKTVEAARAQWDLFINLENMSAESKRLYREYGALCSEISRFLEDMSEGGAGRALMEFTVFKEVLEREFGRG